MKKNRLLALIALTAVSSTSLLASCGGDDSSSVADSTSSSTSSSSSTSTGPESPDFTKLFDMSFIGNKDKFTSDHKGETVTVRGWYTVGGDGNYWDASSSNRGHNGYLALDNGQYMYLHQASLDASENISTEVVAGAEIRVTGTLDIYNGLPQIKDYTYELITPASEMSEDEIKGLFHEVTPEEIKDNLSVNVKDLTAEWALRPIYLKDMVNIEAVTGSGLSQWCPLAYVGTDEQSKYTVQIYRPGITGSLPAGRLYDIYAGVTSYNDVPQLHVGSISDSTVTFKGLQAKDLGTVNDTQKEAIADLQSKVDLDGSYKFSDVDKGDATLASGTSILTAAKDVNGLPGVSIKYDLVTGSDVKDGYVDASKWIKVKSEDPFTVQYSVNTGIDFINQELFSDSSFGTKEVKVQIKRTISGIGAEDIIKYDDVELSFERFEARKDYDIVFTSEDLPNNLEYFTNNSSYPNPSFVTIGGKTGINLYENGGIGITNLVADYRRDVEDFTSFEVISGNRFNSDKDSDVVYTEKGEITITLLNADGTVLGTAVVEQELGKANGVYTNVAEVKLADNLDTITDHKVANMTVYVTSSPTQIMINSVKATFKA